MIFSKVNFDSVFNGCVQLLVGLAKIFGMSYEQINIWIFVIIQPFVFLLMCFWIYTLYRSIKKLKIEMRKTAVSRI